MSTQVMPAQDAGSLSELAIPSEPGVFYSYSSQFSEDRPLYCLLKCKSNKSRRSADAKDLVREIDLVFLFGNSIRVCSPNAAPSVRLFNYSVSVRSLNHTLITPAYQMTAEAFYEMREQKDAEALKKACIQTVMGNHAVEILAPGVVLSVVTESGKYGLFLVKEITPSSLDVDACHVLLP